MCSRAIDHVLPGMSRNMGFCNSTDVEGTGRGHSCRVTSGENWAMGFFLAFMMLGSVAYRGWFNRRSVVTTAGSRSAVVSRPPSICAQERNVCKPGRACLQVKKRSLVCPTADAHWRHCFQLHWVSLRSTRQRHTSLVTVASAPSSETSSFDANVACGQPSKPASSCPAMRRLRPLVNLFHWSKTYDHRWA